jgi:hypothetical protein
MNPWDKVIGTFIAYVDALSKEQLANISQESAKRVGPVGDTFLTKHSAWKKTQEIKSKAYVDARACSRRSTEERYPLPLVMCHHSSMRKHLRWKLVHYAYGDLRWSLTYRNAYVGGVHCKQRRKDGCIGFIDIDRDGMRSIDMYSAATPGPVKHRIEKIVWSLLRNGYRIDLGRGLSRRKSS